MRRPVPSNLDELDLDVREMAKAAARQAGMSLEEWAAAVLAAKDEKRAPLPRMTSQERRPENHHPGSPMPSPSKASRSELERTFEALMAAVSAETERQTQDHASRTAIALESMASWIEQTEERLNETARVSADHQDRMATALSQALTTLKGRLDSVENLAAAERQPDQTWMPAINAISAEIEQLRAGMANLATHEEISSLDNALKDIAKDMGQGAASKDLLILAQSTAAVYRQIQTLSEDLNEGLHGRIGGEIDRLKTRIERMAESGVDRTVIDFLSSQIVDMRHDLSNRAEPRQIERLTEEVTTLGRQIADLRIHQVGRNDLSALKTSLETVCAALNKSVAAQEASDVPAQLDSMSRDLAALTSRPAPESVNLDPITDQLALLTERMATLSESRFQQNDALNVMIERLSAQVQAVADKEAPSQEPLMKRFDRIDEELRQVGEQLGQHADTSSMEHMLRNIDEKLDRVPLKPLSLDALEQQIASLAERLAQKSDEPLQKVLEETTSHLRNLQNDAAGIAERAAKAALKDLQPSLPDAGDLDALKQGFVELKALQSRADKKTQETLRAVHSALETLVSRFPEQGAAPQHAGPISHAMASASPEQMPPEDRLEAAVRRLHAVTLSQIEEVSTTRPEDAATSSEIVVNTPAIDEAELGNVRAGFIAAARRAAQADHAVVPSQSAEEEAVDPVEAIDADGVSTEASASLMERIRQRLDAHRRSLLIGLGFVILAAGTAQVISSGMVPSPLALFDAGKISEANPVPLVKATPHDEAAQTGSIPASSDKTDLFQPSSLTTTAAPVSSAPAAPVTSVAPKFLIDPATVGDIPALVPAALRQAAQAGDATALYDIASRAAEGRGIPQDMILAIHLYERAAQAGLPPAQERLAMIMEKGIGTPRDPKQASMWYERAAQGGNIRAMHNLATLLASGWNGKPDYVAALRWYSEAAEAGLKDSQFNMGVLLTRGIGTKADLPKAYKWFALAAAQGDADASKKRDELAGRLSAADLKTVQAALEQWRPRPVDSIANEVPTPAGGQTATLEQAQGSRS
ncbi:SEL1-like repeat protein [Microvirga guangxiensis]|uniref:Localization factor PodJL n=1 Tax=Microvirga guangxiensis TaxID=549386 RepID=A0A1G5KWS2_9HYPH|nr:SEL1-like repeat protein [Microvirga guangxiensis]SCZ05066.1 localization factor PodJL [Microvirga guangxiensis]